MTHVGAGGRGQRDRRRRAPAPLLPRRRRRLAGGRLRVRPGPRPRRSRRTARRRGRRAADARRSARRAAFTIVLDPSQLYSRSTRAAATRRELDRVFGTEASYAGTSFLTTDKLDERLPLRQRPDHDRRRRHRAGRHGHVRLGRRGRRGAGRAARPERHLRRLPVVARDRAADRPAERGAMRADGWNRIPLIRMTNINLLPQPGMSLDEIVADTDDGLYLASNRSLVDRRPPAELPVRDRGRLRDQGRQEGPAVQEPDVHRHHLRVLAVVRRGRRRAELRDARHAELRQGRARPDAATSATPCPGARFRERPGRASASGERSDGMNDDRARDGARPGRASPRLRRDGGADRGRGLVDGRGRRLTRFANSQIHQNVAETNALVNLRFVAGKRVAVASTDRTDDEGLRRARRAGCGDRPGSSRSSRTGAASPSPTPIRPVPGGLRAGDRRGDRRSCGPRASGRSSPPPTPPASSAYGSFSTATETIARRQLARASGPPGSGPSSQLLTVSMAPDGGSGYAEQAARRRQRRSTPRRSAARPPTRRARPRTRSPSRPATSRSSSRSTRSSTSSTCSATSASRALAVQEERSFVEPGRRVGSELVSIVDDGADPAALPMAFDYEGVAKQRVPLRRARGLPRRRVRRADGGARRSDVDRPRPARPRTRTGRSRSTW